MVADYFKIYFYFNLISIYLNLFQVTHSQDFYLVRIVRVFWQNHYSQGVQNCTTYTHFLYRTLQFYCAILWRVQSLRNFVFYNLDFFFRTVRVRNTHAHQARKRCGTRTHCVSPHTAVAGQDFKMRRLHTNLLNIKL